MATIKSIKVKPKKVPSANKVPVGQTAISTAIMGAQPVDLSTVSASSPFKSKVIQTGAAPFKSAVEMGSSNVSSADKIKPTSVPQAGSVNDQMSMMEQQAANNIYDPAIGYGHAMPGETGTQAVERLKKARVKRKGK
jgi:hypothetical protein